MLLQCLELCFFVIRARHRRRHRSFPIMDGNPLSKRRRSRAQRKGLSSAMPAPSASHADRVCILSRFILRHGRMTVLRIEHTIPAVLHIGDTTSQRFFAQTSCPIVARGHPFVDKLLCPSLEEVRGARRKTQDKAMWPLPAIAWWRK